MTERHAKPSIEQLVQRVREFPSPEVRLAGLRAALSIIESRLDGARIVEAERLRTRQRNEQPHPDDAAIDSYELEDQLLHVLPKIARGGFVLALWSTPAACTKDLALFASERTVKATEIAFDRQLGVPAAAVRAALVHHNGETSRLPEDLRSGGLLTLEADGLYADRDLHHEYFVPTHAFLEARLELIDAPWNSRAQWCAPEHASMPIVHGGSAAISSLGRPRGTLGLTSSGRPASLTPCTAKTFLARSIPANRIDMDFPSRTS